MTLTEDILTRASQGPVGLDDTDRMGLLAAAEKLTLALENPIEKFARMFMALYDPIVIRIAVDLKLVDIALAHGNPITAAELARQSKADVELIHRLLRLLVPIQIFIEDASAKEKTYIAAPFGHALATGSPLRSAILHFSQVFVSTAAMPDYFAARGYSNPSSALDSPFTFAYNCKGSTYFDFLARPGQEEMSRAFNETMALQRLNEEPGFVADYLVERLKIEDPRRVLFVDVGGGVGHQLLKFHARCLAAGMQGKLALQDLPGVVAEAKGLPDDVLKVGHDFFQPQPESVKGAKAFYLRTVLHDWPQTEAEAVLRHIVNGMAKDSVVLLHEVILPAMGVEHFDAKVDWHLMNLGALERTEEQWRTLVGGVGLQVQGIWWEPEDTKGRRALIECGLKG
ncbi:hypothetical protein E8E12_006039 [Didymella heteroderae]|uniref:O-methyltransferase n=1 Tax=Didymella heteroderae TaxID=1769908 RepID=A0A9P4WMZ1_9PLEO|nr:hypothetical protein E8E12_006039 [Didymella heteroderae]